MTIKQLIEQLQALPQDAQVSVEDDDDYESYIVGIEFTGEFVIIEIQDLRNWHKRSPTVLLPNLQKLNDKHGNIWTF